MPVAADIYYHAYREEDKGKLPVVLIHGAGGMHLNWPAEVRRLPGFRIYALDLPGHGKSSGRGQQSISAYTLALLNWLEAVGLHRAVFVGHSMGGAIIQYLALTYPEHVLAMGLLGSAAKLPVNPALLKAAAHPTTFHNAVEKIVAWSYGPEAPDKLVELAVSRMTEVRPSVLHADFLACDAFDETERVANINLPMLVLCGTEDKMTPLRNSQFLVDSIPTARLEIIPNAGHMLMLEKPQEVAAALANFLSGIQY